MTEGAQDDPVRAWERDAERGPYVQQYRFFVKDIARITGGDKRRLLIVWSTPMFWGMLLFRFEHAMYLRWGNRWRWLRQPLLPLVVLIRLFTGNLDISYRAHIGPGFMVLHPALGIVIPNIARLGENVTLVGGNCLGSRNYRDIRIHLGDRVTVGANACILGSVTLGDDVTVGACAVVLDDFAGPGSLVGAPAAPVRDRSVPKA